jgi:hypothetical protein
LYDSLSFTWVSISVGVLSVHLSGCKPIQMLPVGSSYARAPSLNHAFGRHQPIVCFFPSPDSAVCFEARCKPNPHSLLNKCFLLSANDEENELFLTRKCRFAKQATIHQRRSLALYFPPYYQLSYERTFSSKFNLGRKIRIRRLPLGI